MTWWFELNLNMHAKFLSSKFKRPMFPLIAGSNLIVNIKAQIAQSLCWQPLFYARQSCMLHDYFGKVGQM